MLTFRSTGSSSSEQRGANALNVSFETLYGGQLTLSTQLTILNYPVILSTYAAPHATDSLFI